MSDEPKSSGPEKISCPERGQEMSMSEVKREGTAYPKVKGTFAQREYVCEACGEEVRGGRFHEV